MAPTLAGAACDARHRAYCLLFAPNRLIYPSLRQFAPALRHFMLVAECVGAYLYNQVVEENARYSTECDFR